jgi:hypothetical protein
MRGPGVLDSIYLNKRGHDQDTRHWVYYRVTSLGGKFSDHIQVCLLAWPLFSDIDVVGEEDKAPVVNPADTGFIYAYPNLCNLLTKKWNVDHEQSILIGIRERAA